MLLELAFGKCFERKILFPRPRLLRQVLMTREYRLRLAAGGGPPPKAPTFATVRVRLPEGLMLQGEFNAGEPVRRA